MNFLKYIIVISLLLICRQLPAQQVISGIITDRQSDEPLVGAGIVIPGTTTGTVTNELGKFLLQVPDSTSAIQVHFIGYEPALITHLKENMHLALNPSFSMLSQVIVSASREKELRTEVPAAIAIVSPKMLEETCPNTLDQVLNKIPGVFVADLANEQHMTSIRQPISTKGLFLFLEDGLPTRPTGVFNHNAMNELNQAAIKRIEVIRGPASSTYGAEAIGGVINVITHTPTPDLSGHIALRANSNGLRRTDLRISNTYGKTGVFMGGYYSRRRNGYFDHSDMDKYAGTLKVTHVFSNDTDANVSVTYADLVTDMTGNLDSAHFFSKDLSSRQTFTGRKVKALRFQSTLNHDWHKNASTSARLFYRDNIIGQVPSYRIRTDKNTGVTSGTVNAQTLHSYGALIQHTQTFDRFRTRVIGGISIDYSPTAFFEDYILVAQHAGINVDYVTTDSALTKNEIDLTNLGTYATIRFNPIENLRVSASIRYDRFKYTHRNFLPPSSFSGAPNASSVFEAITPKIGFTYDFGKNRGFYANFAQGFVPPQVSELYRGVTVPTLEPAVYYNYEIGGWFTCRINDQIGARGDLAFYSLNATNQIISVLQDDGTRENENAGQTASRGIEYALNLHYGSAIQFRWSGSFARHRFIDYVENGRSFNGNEMAQGAHVQFNWEITYRPAFLNDLRLSLENQFLGPYWTNNANTRKYGGFNLFNIRAGYEFRRIDVGLTVLNVTDTLWSPRVSSSGYGVQYVPGIPRTYQVNLAYTLGRSTER